MDILGVSHIVVGTRDPAAVEEFFIDGGYRTAGGNSAAPAMPPRAPFVSGPMASTTEVRLLVSDHGLPAIELVRENRPADGAAEGTPAFEGLLGLDGDPSPDVISGIPTEEGNSLVPGFRGATGTRGEVHSMSVVVRCPDLDQAFDLWRGIGPRPETLGNGIVKVAFPRTLAGAGLDLYYVEGRNTTDRTWLNQEGLVCVALVCKDPDGLRGTLDARGLETSECFGLCPFGTSLRLFFVRNRTGELYEFLSPAPASRRVRVPASTGH